MPICLSDSKEPSSFATVPLFGFFVFFFNRPPGYCRIGSMRLDITRHVLHDTGASIHIHGNTYLFKGK